MNPPREFCYSLILIGIPPTSWYTRPLVPITPTTVTINHPSYIWLSPVPYSVSFIRNNGFVSLLQGCSTLREAHQLHAQMLKTGAFRDPLLVDRLVSFCALSDAGDLHYALRIVSSLSYQSAVMWNTLLQGYSLSCTPELCILLYRQMLEEFSSLLLNRYSFPPVLRACAKLCAVVEGAQVHGYAVKLGAVVDLYVQNSLIQMYFRCGDSRVARLLFDRMLHRNVVSWNCLIAGYAELGCWEMIKSLFWSMVEEFSVAPNSFTLVRMLTACTRSGDFLMGKRIHRYITDNGVGMCLNLANVLMNMYAKFGEMDEALIFFREMPNQDVVSWTALISGYMGVGHLAVAREFFDKMPEWNIVAWNAMISGYVLNDCFKDALLLFKEMMVLAVKPDNVTFVNVLSACARMGDLVLGRAIHGHIYKFGMEMTLELIHSLLCLYVKCESMEYAKCLFKKMTARNEISWTLMMEGYVRCGTKEIAFEIFNQMPYKDVASWNALITALCQHNFYKDALDIFEEMQRQKVAPTPITLVSALSACARVGALAVGKWIHSYIDRNSIEVDGHLSCALIDMYAKCGCVDLSLKVFNNMPVKDLLSWSTMIGGLAVHGHANLALKLFKKMINDGIEPDGISFLGVLVACCHAGLVDEGRQYFDLMTQVYGISPRTEHYTCMVDLYGRQGLLNDAKNFINNVTAFTNGKSIWGALLSACSNHGNVELAEFAMNRLLDMDPTNSGANVLLSNVYSKASKWDSVGKIRNMMRANGVQKIPGCSSIEVAGAVHEFFIGDTSHPQCDEIYVMLDGLENQLEAA